MGCDPERVTGYVDGELSEAVAGETRRHLSICRSCTAQARFELDLGDVLRVLPDPAPSPCAVQELSAVLSELRIQ
jgi:anti-sigma factor RsiW